FTRLDKLARRRGRTRTRDPCERSWGDEHRTHIGTVAVARIPGATAVVRWNQLGDVLRPHGPRWTVLEDRMHCRGCRRCQRQRRDQPLRGRIGPPAAASLRELEEAAEEALRSC